MFACLQTFCQRIIKASELLVDNNEESYVLKSDFKIIVDSSKISTSIGVLKIISKDSTSYLTQLDNKMYRTTLNEWQLTIENIATKDTYIYYLTKEEKQ